MYFCSMKRTAIIGGGAAGFFLAINLKEMVPEMEVTIFERGSRVLKKVEVSGGGRCNCTNSFEGVKDLSAVYPRGHRLMKRLFKTFDYRDAYDWFERHGVELTTQEDHCVFPAAQDSHAVIDCFLQNARRYGVKIVMNRRVTSLQELKDYDFVAVTTGGMKALPIALPEEEGSKKLEVVEPVPSLFTFNIEDAALRELMGTVVEDATAFIPGLKYRSTGALLITHWGMSGPAILKLSSHAARLLADYDYRMPLCVNWLSLNEQETLSALQDVMRNNPLRQARNAGLLPNRLWDYLSRKALGERANCRWTDLNKKDINRLVSTLTADNYQITGRGTYKEEFVTCGGVALGSVNPNTLESKHFPGLYFAGEVLDIDGITGGFNFQAAWTTAYTVAKAIAEATRIG